MARGPLGGIVATIALTGRVWCDAQPPDALFHEIFPFGTRWYAVLACRLGDYREHMRKRSAKWDTVSIPAKAFAEITVPLKQLL